jgi:hypothetical protein
MALLCPRCEYDVTSLLESKIDRCPECGQGIPPVKRLRWATRRHWKRFFLTPIFALPAVAVFGIGYPLTCLGFTTYFAFRAMRSDGPGGEHSKAILILAAFLCALTWTIMTALPLSLPIAALWQAWW